MGMSKGTKIVAPFVRATSSTGIIHAVENLDEKAARTVCGKPTTGADEPIKRFQSGVEGMCGKCYPKVVAARIERVQARKAARGKTLVDA